MLGQGQTVKAHQILSPNGQTQIHSQRKKGMLGVHAPEIVRPVASAAQLQEVVRKVMMIDLWPASRKRPPSPSQTSSSESSSTTRRLVGWAVDAMTISSSSSWSSSADLLPAGSSSSEIGKGTGKTQRKKLGQ